MTTPDSMDAPPTSDPSTPEHLNPRPARQVRRAFRGTGSFEFPGIVVGAPDRHVVWGLTYRFLEVFFRALGRPFPDSWREIEAAVRDHLREA